TIGATCCFEDKFRNLFTCKFHYSVDFLIRTPKIRILELTHFLGTLPSQLAFIGNRSGLRYLDFLQAQEEKPGSARRIFFLRFPIREGRRRLYL
ncbi:MAG: hypothetical protein SOY99_04865, partial [Alloprevotella sp.]|nr:hypothetical protein [Alloprevotella sp.]